MEELEEKEFEELEAKKVFQDIKFILYAGLFSIWIISIIYIINTLS